MKDIAINTVRLGRWRRVAFSNKPGTVTIDKSITVGSEGISGGNGSGTHAVRYTGSHHNGPIGGQRPRARGALAPSRHLFEDRLGVFDGVGRNVDAGDLNAGKRGGEIV